MSEEDIKALHEEYDIHEVEKDKVEKSCDNCLIKGRDMIRCFRCLNGSNWVKEKKDEKR